MKYPICLLFVASSCLAGPQHDAAMLAYERGDYALALVELQAAQDDSLAQEMLGFMYAWGGDLYPGVHRDMTQALFWFDRAARNGRPVSDYMRCALRRAPSAARCASSNGHAVVTTRQSASSEPAP